MILSCADTFHLICSGVNDVRSLGLLCRTSKGIRGYLNSLAGGVHWTRVGKLTCGLRYWKPLPENHPRAADAKYVAQIRICPWTSMPSALNIKFMDRLVECGSEDVIIKEMDLDLSNEHNPLIVHLACTKASKSFPSKSYCVSVREKPWAAPRLERLAKGVREGCARSQSDNALFKRWKSKVGSLCDYYRQNEWQGVVQVHDGLCAIMISYGGDTQVIFFFSSKDMRFLGRLPMTSSCCAPGSVVFGCGEFWLLSREHDAVCYYGPSLNSTSYSPCELDRGDYVFVLFRNGYLQQALDYAKLIKCDIGTLTCSLSGRTLLHHAVSMGSRDAIRMLIENGMSPDAVSVDHMHVIFYAAIENMFDMIPVLVEFGSNINWVRNQGADQYSWDRNPTGYKSILAEYAGSFSRCVQGVRVLVQNGADVNWMSASGYSPLWGACRGFGGPDIVRELCELGANPNARTPDGQSLFYRLVVDDYFQPGWGHISTQELFSVLYKYGCDVNAESGPHNRTALMEATVLGRTGLAQTLMFL